MITRKVNNNKVGLALICDRLCRVKALNLANIAFSKCPIVR